MLGKKKILDLIGFVLKRSRADQTEVLVSCFTSYLTRYANNYIHQNVGEENVAITIRTVIGSRIGIASTNHCGKDKLTETLDNAVAITRLQPENPDFRTLPFAGKKAYRSTLTFFPPTAAFSPQKRADAVKSITEVAREAGVKSYGSFTTGTSQIGIGNSLGIMVYNQTTDAYCNVVMMGESSTGYAEAASRDVRAIKPVKCAEVARDKLRASRDPIDMPAGRYTVILEPAAVAEMLDFFNFLGFGAKTYHEGRSFLKGKLGTKIVDDRVTIIDDAYSKKGFAFPFDFEGMPRKRIKLVEKGVARDLAYDSLTAFKEGKESTGHALAQPNYMGPVAVNLVMKGGESSLEQMVKSTQKGILVTRFHYTNTVEPMKTIITGMTRDGTFLVENGAVTRGVKNLRFTQSVLEALNRIVAISKKTTLVGGGAGYGGRYAVGSIVPALKIDGFNFSGTTQF